MATQQVAANRGSTLITPNYLDDLNTNSQVRLIQVYSVSLSGIHYHGSKFSNCVISLDATVVPGFIHHTKLQGKKFQILSKKSSL